MDVGSVRTQAAGQVAPKNFRSIYSSGESAIQDGFHKGAKSEDLDADKMKSLQTDGSKKSRGMLNARELTSLAVVFGGLIAGAAIGGPFGVGLLICGPVGGLAILTGPMFKGLHL